MGAFDQIIISQISDISKPCKSNKPFKSNISIKARVPHESKCHGN